MFDMEGLRFFGGGTHTIHTPASGLVKHRSENPTAIAPKLVSKTQELPPAAPTGHSSAPPPSVTSPPLVCAGRKECGVCPHAATQQQE